ncbi:MAG: hypothetical protein AB7N91_05420 [Candidatus Tectimicrobiota bacterium]
MELSPEQTRCYTALHHVLDTHISDRGLTAEGLSLVMATMTGELVAQLYRMHPQEPRLLQMVSRALWQCCRDGARTPLEALPSRTPPEAEQLRQLAYDMLRLLAEYTTEARLTPWHVLLVLMQCQADFWAPVARGDESLLEHADGLWQDYLRRQYPALRL